MFSRRGFLSAIMGSTAVAGTPIAEGSPISSAQPLQLLSPKDAFVLNTAVSSGSLVKAGDTIFQLDTDNEDRSLDQIALALALLALEDTSTDYGNVVPAHPTPFDVQAGQHTGIAPGDKFTFPTAHPLGLRKLVLQTTMETAQAYLDFASDKQAAANLQNQNGGGNFGAALSPTIAAQVKAGNTQNAAAVATASAEVFKASIASARFQLAVAQLQKKQDLIRSQLAKEHDRIAAVKGRLTITAPIAGKITLATTTGCFVKLGHALAEIAL